MYAHTDSVGLRQTTDWEGDPGNLGFALTDIRRRSEASNDTLTLDVQLNYWSGSLDVGVQEVWGDGLPEWDVDTVYVGGDVTVPEGTTLTIESGTVVQLAGAGDMMGTGTSTKTEMLVYGALIAEDRPDCFWLYVVTNCATAPELQEPIKDPARFPWHEVTKVQHYWLDVNP